MKIKEINFDFQFCQNIHKLNKKRASFWSARQKLTALKLLIWWPSLKGVDPGPCIINLKPQKYPENSQALKCEDSSWKGRILSFQMNEVFWARLWIKTLRVFFRKKWVASFYSNWNFSQSIIECIIHSLKILGFQFFLEDGNFRLKEAFLRLKWDEPLVGNVFYLNFIFRNFANWLNF